LVKVAYFTSLLNNVTSGVNGYKAPSKKDKAELVEVLTRIVKVGPASVSSASHASASARGAACYWRERHPGQRRSRDHQALPVRAVVLPLLGAATHCARSYTFPVSNIAESFTLANVFTDVVLSVLPLAQTTFATDGGQELGLVQLVSSHKTHLAKAHTKARLAPSLPRRASRTASTATHRRRSRPPRLSSPRPTPSSL
jgi:hypothetical protein